MKIKVPFFKQDTDYTCGPTALEMVIGFFGKRISESNLAKEAHTSIDGTKHSGMIETARKEGFFCYVDSDSSISEIKKFLKQGFPVIVHFTLEKENEGHYAVVIGFGLKHFILNDPWQGKGVKIPEHRFESYWVDKHMGANRWMMIVSRENLPTLSMGKKYDPINS